MAKFTPCRHDGESMVSLMEQHGYSEDDMLLCKLCQKEEIEGLTTALEQWKKQYQDVHAEVGILNDEARELQVRIKNLEEALNIIAGHERCVDNLMSNMDIATKALQSAGDTDA